MESLRLAILAQVRDFILLPPTLLFLLLATLLYYYYDLHQPTKALLPALPCLAFSGVTADACVVAGCSRLPPWTAYLRPPFACPAAVPAAALASFH